MTDPNNRKEQHREWLQEFHAFKSKKLTYTVLNLVAVHTLDIKAKISSLAKAYESRLTLNPPANHKTIPKKAEKNAKNSKSLPNHLFHLS